MNAYDSKKILIFGAGAIGSSVGGWLAPHYESLYFFDRPEITAALRTKGLTHYQGGTPADRETVPVKAIDDLAEAPDADVVIIAVKNYSLDAVSRLVRDKLGDRPLIIGMQNGVENQNILPAFFSKVVYCVVSYNAWLDEPGVVGYQKRGPLIIGTRHNELGAEMSALAASFSRGVETIVTPHLGDATHCKLVINLTNSLTTLVGHTYRPISDPALFQKLLTNLTWEGVEITKAAGYRECKLGGMPSWGKLWAGAHLPRLITKPMFERNVKKMVLSSMAQDILQRGGTESEIETINGYLLRLADRHGVDAPFNRAIYALSKEEFAKPDFEPLDVTAVWARVQEELGA